MSGRGLHFCSQGVAEEEALKKGMEEKSSELYAKA